MIYLVSAFDAPSKAKTWVENYGTGRISGAVHWLYLGRNYMKLAHWEALLGPSWTRISYGRYFQALAKELKHDYLKWISDMGRSYHGEDAIAWWASRISEKNTLLDSLFHLICYLFTGYHYIKRHTRLLIVCENPSVLSKIAGCTDLSGQTACMGDIWSPLNSADVFEKRRTQLWETYIGEGMSAVNDAKTTFKPANEIPPVSEKSRILIHTWVNESYFGEDGNANDSYFTVLPDLLRERGFDVIILPCVYDIKRTRKQAFSWFRAHGARYLIPEDYYDITDYQWTADTATLLSMPSEDDLVFNGENVSLLMTETIRSQSCDVGIGPFLQYYRLFHRLWEKGIHFDYFIDTFENMIPEKLSVMGIKKRMPHVKTIGYQHYMNLNDLLLCFFTTPEETGFAPHPDVIVCNSRITYRQLIDASFREDRLRIGPSLRYQHLLDRRQVGISNEKHVMVVTGIDMSARELIIKIVQAFPKDEGVRFSIKPHPMVGKETFEWISHLRLPRHMKVVSGKLHELIQTCACAVVAGSTSALELALTGIPVIVAGRETDFTMTPVTSIWGAEDPAYSGRELREKIFNAINLSLEEMKDFNAWIDKTILQGVTPINPITVSRFIDNIFSRDVA